MNCMSDKAQVHPSHYMDISEELARLHQKIGALKTECSSLKSELLALDRKSSDDDAEDALLDAAAAFLKKVGADVFVIGGVRVQHQPGGLLFSHEVVISFIGKPPESAS